MKALFMYVCTGLLLYIVADATFAQTFQQTIYKRADNTIEYRVILRDFTKDAEMQQAINNTIQALNAARPQDIVTIHVASLGGWISIEYDIARAIVGSKAGRVLTYVYYADSAASKFPFLLTSAYYDGRSSVMFHAGALCENNKLDNTCVPLAGEELADACESFKKIAPGLPITAKGVEDYCAGKDVYVKYNDLEATNARKCSTPSAWCRWLPKRH